MTMIQGLFYLFAAVAIFAASMVVLGKNPVRSVLFLVLTFFATAGIWLLLHAEFLALILVLVYVGDVMTLFLFVVMMLNVNVENTKEGFVRYLPIGIILLALTLIISVLVLGPEHFGLSQALSPGLKSADYNNLTNLGMVLYTTYVYPFEISAVILLTAIIAAISLTHRKTRHRRSQSVSQQIATRPEDRLRLIDIPSEPKQSGAGK
jgi:NADH-quinone oxidoreductase subunit J